MDKFHFASSWKRLESADKVLPVDGQRIAWAGGSRIGSFPYHWGAMRPALSNVEAVMKYLCTALVMIAIAGVSTGVMASPVMLPGGPIYFDYETAEQYSKSNDINNVLNPAAAGVASGNWGIVQVESIVVGKALTPSGWQIDPLGPTIFSNGSGAQILGIFYGIQNNSFPSASSSGGTLDLYYWNSNSQDVDAELADANNLSKRSANGTQYTGFTCQTNDANCTFLARFQFSPGADLASSVNTIFSVPGSTTFETYMSVDPTAPGEWTNLLESNYFTLNPAQERCGDPGVLSCLSANDIRADGAITAGAAGWTIENTDIITLRKGGALRAFVVPESGSLPLVLLALASLGIVSVRCRSALRMQGPG